MVATASRHANVSDVNWSEGVTGRLAGVTEIADLLGVSRARADQLSRQQGFPAPYDVLAARTPRPQRVWLTEAIRAWHRENPRIGRNDPA